jgi:hypothetical protein
MSKLPDPRPAGERPRPSLVRHYGAVFGRFWWEFLVGDTPELLIGAALVVVVGAVLAHQGMARVVVVASMPVLVIALLAASVRRAQRAARPSRRPRA